MKESGAFTKRSPRGFVRGEAGLGVLEAAIVAPLLISLMFMFVHLSHFAVDYMSMSALAHDSSEISSQTHAPVPSPAFAMASFIADEDGYKTCLAEIQGETPSEFCLTAVARWRSEKLAQSLRLEESIKEFNVEARYQPNGGEADRPQLEVRISGVPARFPGSTFSWNLSAEAVGALRD